MTPKNQANNTQPVTKIVACPNCKKSVRWDATSQYRPFCSKRCQLIDLGDWANESHRIPGAGELVDETD